MDNKKSLGKTTTEKSEEYINLFAQHEDDIYFGHSQTVELIAKFNGDLEPIERDLGAEVEILYQGYAIITIDRVNIPALYSYPQIEHLEVPKNLYFYGSYNLISSCISSVQNANSYNLTGSGVIIALIDSGIDYTHNDFRNADSTSRILYLWDQTIDGSPPLGFYGGTEYNNFQINQALNSDDPYSIVPSYDSLSHGTAVAGIAAGNGSESSGVNKGVAPDANLIVVKVGTRGYESFARSTEIMRALKYVIEKALILGMPVAINMSFGMNEGSHLGTSIFESYVSEISFKWKSVIVIPTGNEGAAGHHYSGKIASNQEQDINFFTSEGITTFFITLWKNFVDLFSVEVIFPNGNSSGIIGMESQIKTVRQGNIVLNIVYGQPSHYSVNQEIFFHFEASSGAIAPGLWRVKIISRNVVDGNYNMWLPTVEQVTADTAFSTPDPYFSLTIPSTSRRIICVAGYNDRIGNITEFSGKGNQNQVLPNPDVAAPAMDILTTKSGGGYDTFTGTSVAAPFVTGCAALIMQWGIVNGNDPFLYGEKVKAFLRIGATRQSGTTYPNPYFGYGRLCLSSTMEYLTEYTQGGVNIWRML